jgi:hypothetical protein
MIRRTSVPRLLAITSMAVVVTAFGGAATRAAAAPPSSGTFRISTRAFTASGRYVNLEQCPASGCHDGLDQRFDYSATYPVVSGGAEPSIEDKVNQVLHDAVYQRVRAWMMQVGIAGDPTAGPPANPSYSPNDEASMFETDAPEIVAGRYVSVLFDQGGHQPGANDSPPAGWAVTVDLADGHRITSRDFFRADRDPTDLLAIATTRVIEQSPCASTINQWVAGVQPRESVQDAVRTQLSPSSADPGAVYSLTPSGLLVTFSPLSGLTDMNGCKNMDLFGFTIPYARLTAILAPQILTGLTSLKETTTTTTQRPAGGPPCSSAVGLERDMHTFAGRKIALPQHSIDLPANMQGQLEVTFSLGDVSICRNQYTLPVPGYSLSGELSVNPMGPDGTEHGPFRYAAEGTAWKPSPEMPPGQDLTSHFEPAKFAASVNPSLSFGNADPSLSIASAELQADPLDTTLSHRGQAIINVKVGPTITLGISISPKNLEQLDEQAQSEGVDAHLAADDVAEELAGDAGVALEEEASVFFGVDVTPTVQQLTHDLDTSLVDAINNDATITSYETALADEAAASVVTADESAAIAEATGSAEFDVSAVDVLELVLAL